MGMSNVQVNNITSNSADVSWDTDVVATTGLILSQQQADGTWVDSRLQNLNIPDSTSHDYPLNSLLPNTTYAASSLSYDNNNGINLPCDSASCRVQFKTPAAAQPPAPTDTLTPQPFYAVLNIGQEATFNITVKDSTGKAKPGVMLNAELLPISAAQGNVTAPVITDGNGVAALKFKATGIKYPSLNQAPGIIEVYGQDPKQAPHIFLGLLVKR